MARVLVADDTAYMRTLMRLSVERGQHTVIEAADGDQALAYLRSQRFDVAVIDAMMPGLDGLAVCRIIRADENLREIGIVVVSANVCAAEASRAGADHFLLKPFTPTALLAVVNEVERTLQARMPSATRCVVGADKGGIAPIRHRAVRKARELHASLLSGGEYSGVHES